MVFFYNLNLSTPDLRFDLLSKMYNTRRARAPASQGIIGYTGTYIAGTAYTYCVSQQTTDKSSETRENSGVLAPELSAAKVSDGGKQPPDLSSQF